MSPVPQRIILDTDLGSDCDDAGALAVLHALADTGEAEILACIYSSERNPYGPGCLAAINAWYGRPDVPIGSAGPGDLGDPRNDFLEPIARDQATHGHAILSRDEVADLVTVYRRALAHAPDGSVKIVTIGHTKGLHSLLHSGPDDASDLPGRELVRCKVATWVAMGGQFPIEPQPGWNFGKNGAARYTQSLVTGWPTPILFSGYEIGRAILTGRGLGSTPPGNPVREAYRLWENALKYGRASWDQTAVLAAVRDPHAYWDLARGYGEVDASGRIQWQPDPQGPHAHLVEKVPPAEMARMIEELMVRAPKLRPRS